MGALSISSHGAQVHCPRRISASSRLPSNLALLSLGSLDFFYYLAPFWGATSPSSKSYDGLFFLKSGMDFNLMLAGSEGGGRGRLGATWVLGASLEVCPLFVLAIKPFKLVLCFRSMLSSSSELVSGRAAINLGWWTIENLSDSVSKSKSSTGLFWSPLLFSKVELVDLSV